MIKYLWEYQLFNFWWEFVAGNEDCEYLQDFARKCEIFLVFRKSFYCIVLKEIMSILIYYD